MQPKHPPPAKQGKILDFHPSAAGVFLESTVATNCGSSPHVLPGKCWVFGMFPSKNPAKITGISICPRRAPEPAARQRGTAADSEQRRGCGGAAAQERLQREALADGDDVPTLLVVFFWFP